MKEIELRKTKRFAIDCWKLATKFPNTRECNNYENQLFKCSSSVGANYRAAQRGKSTTDFINKLKIVEEETDESMYGLEIFMALSDSNHDELKGMHTEANELLAKVVASIKTSKRNQIKKRN